MAQVERLCYTWKDCFAFSVGDIDTTDLITHSVELREGAVPYRLKQPGYSKEQRRFALKFFAELKRAGWIYPAIGPWAAYSLFPPKGNTFRTVFDYRPVNNATEPPQWPVHNQAHIFEDLLQAGHGVFFQADAAHGFHGVRITPGDEYKAAVITPHAQYFTSRMPQGMTGSINTYCALGDMMFGQWPMPGGQQGTELPNLVGHLPHLGVSFNQFIDNHSGSATSFKSLFDFLHSSYFPHLIFGIVKLKPSKTVLFSSGLSLLGFELSKGMLRPQHKHRDRFKRWAKVENHPRNRKELDAFLWLLPYLKEFIPGRAALVQLLKTAGIRQVPKITPTRRESKQMTWVDKDKFEWNEDHARAFRDICKIVQSQVNNAPD